MAYATQFQKLCQVDTKRLVFGAGIIFIFVLVFQFSSLPYGDVLLSMLSARYMIQDGLTPSHDSNSTNSSLVHEVGRVFNGSNSTNSSFGETKGREKDLINGFQMQVNQNPVNNSVSEKVLVSDENKLESADFLDHEVAMSPDSVDTGLTPKNVESPGPGLVSQLPNLTSMNQSSINSNKSVVPIEPEMSSVSKQPTEELPKVGNPLTLQRSSVNSSSNSTSSDSKTKLKRMVPHTSMSQMNSLLLQSRTSSHAMRPQWSTVRDQELLAAKSEIVSAPVMKSDLEIYAPLFRNASLFIRSYELMEHTLKVFTYMEGENPIFHQPNLNGIYASEGWFMKLMEENKQFTVKDPSEAHLFYFPFSSYMLRQTLYDSQSRNRKKLGEYLKDYVDMIAGKYHFWNRTGGADHFVVACHDWAPRETRLYMGSCIRALCNTNINSGFEIGKDVSLPVTYVHDVENPLKSLGGKPPSRRSVLAFFAGGMHGYLRPILLEYWGKDPDMKIFGQLPREGDGTMNYKQYMKSSKYCICARGYEVHTPRVVEAIFYECVPVIISDNYVPPFFEVLNWEAFSVFVPEKDIPNLRNILLSIPKKKYLMLQKRVKQVQKHFIWHKKPLKYDVFHMTLHSIWYNRVFQVSSR